MGRSCPYHLSVPLAVCADAVLPAPNVISVENNANATASTRRPPRP